MLTVNEVAKILRIAPRTVRNLIKAKTIPAKRIGRQVRIIEGDLKLYLNNAAA